jgi:PAS domain S-box-containing protein
MNTLQKNKPWVYAVQIVGFALLYVAAGLASLSLASPEQATSRNIFAAEGVALAVVLLLGVRLWPGVFLGQIILAFIHGMTWEVGLGLAVVSSLEVVIAAKLFGWLNIHPSLHRMRDVAKLHLLIVLVLQPFSTMFCTGILWLNNPHRAPGEYGGIWASWWLANVLGQLLLAPMLLTFFSRARTVQVFLREELLMLLPLLLAGFLVFSGTALLPESMAFAIMTPILAMIALRRGMVAATTGVALIAGMALYCTHLKTGPFVVKDTVNQLGLNAFLFFTAITVQFTTALFTERTDLEEDLSQSQQMMRLVLDRFPGVVFWKDRQSVYLGCNNAFASAAGLGTSSDIVGKTDFELPWGKNEAEASRDDDRMVMHSGKPKIGIIEPQFQAGGRLAWFHTNKLPLLDANGASIGVLGASTDITALKQAEDELRLNAESHKKINSMVVDILHHSWNTRKSPGELAAYLARRTGDTLNVDIVAVWVYSETDQKLRSLARYHQLTGMLQPDEAYDMSDMKPYMDINVDSRYTIVNSWDAYPTPPGFMDRIIRPSGIKSTLFAPIRRHGRQLGLVSLSQTRDRKNWTPEEGSAVATLADVMGQIITEDELRRTQEEINQLNTTLEQKVGDRTAQLEEARRVAEEAAQSKGTFLAIMSHEIRTPMNGVLGMADLLATTPLNTEQRDWLETLRSSGQSLLGLLNDILDFSKMEAGKLALEEAPFDLRAQVNAVAALLEGKAQEKDLHIQTFVDMDVPDVFIGDALRLRQILTNLVGNAIKFTEHGRIDIGVQVNPGPAPSGAAEPATWLHFTVQDTGIGITPDALPKLFQPFTQADDSTTRQFGGTGLGLSICKLLIERMNGRIWLESEEGRGSTCHVLVALQVAEPPEGRQTEASRWPATSAVRCDVLLVEDNPVNQKVAVAMLTKRGHRVTVANDGTEALAAIASGPFDIILMDVQMPVMDGLETTAHIRRREAETGEAHRHIVAMTAHSMGGDRERCLAAGMDDYMCKPFKAEELYGVVEFNQTPAPPQAAAPATGNPPPADAPPADLALALEMVAGERAILEDVARAYLQEEGGMLGAIRAAIAKNDAAGLHLAAHTLKGTVSLFQAGTALQLTLALEHMGREKQMAAAETTLGRLEQELARLSAQLKKWLEPGSN